MGSDGKTAMVGGIGSGALAVVDGKFWLLERPAFTTENHEDTNEGESKKDEDEERDQEVDHSRAETLIIGRVVSDDQFVKSVQHLVMDSVAKEVVSLVFFVDVSRMSGIDLRLGSIGMFS